MKKYYLAIDIGASSGRHIVGYKQGGEIVLKEVYRFYNGMVDNGDDLIWNVSALFDEIVKGIALCIQKFGRINSLAIDTWGVDYALIDGDKLISPVNAYRSGRTKNAIKKVHEIISKRRLYEITGEQFQNFNTIYQLYADKAEGRLEKATDFLMMPEYFNYLLTGKKVKEYTNATTGALVNVKTKEFDDEIIGALGLNKKLFPKLHFAGEEVGDLLPEIQAKVGGNIKVKLCASHDTASAFEAVDTEENSVIISSGTWSLVGVNIKNADISVRSFESNFANEGGVGYFRYLKNIMGMWIVNRCCQELGLDIVTAVEKARKSTYRRTFDVNDESLNAPESMLKAIKTLLNESDLDVGDLFSSIFNSLAISYRKTIKEIEENLDISVPFVYIVGGGAKNRYLNELTEEYCKIPVVAMAIEATAFGNIKTQMGEKI
ncbi:MAG: rhamnulokinase [Clostridia bacterium]|nr:rhamnulokinase [Clostridia bacterium]